MRNEKRKYVILNRIWQVIHSYIVFYKYETDLNTSLPDTDRWESIILNRIGQVIHSNIVFYNDEIDLNTGLQDTDRWESIYSKELIKSLQ